MDPNPIPTDTEYLTQLKYKSIPDERLIKIGVHWFDLELLALWIQINPSNPLTRSIISPENIWKIIIKYNNYLNSQDAILTREPKKYIYTQNQLNQINAELEQSTNSNSPIHESIIRLIDSIRQNQNNITVSEVRTQTQTQAREFDMIRQTITNGSNTNSVYEFVVGSRYIYIHNRTGIIGITEPYSSTIDRIPRFGHDNIPMGLTSYIFYQNNNNYNDQVQLPRPLELNQLVEGTEYISLFYSNTILGKLEPFVGFNENGDPKFSKNLYGSVVIFNKDCHHFYNQIDLNKIGIKYNLR